MARYIFLAFTNPTSEEQEQEYNEWYDTHHLKDVIDVPGFVSARRFRLAKSQFEFNTVPPAYKYLAFYEMDVDDPAASLKEVAERAKTGGMLMIDAIDMATLSSPVYEEITPAILAEDARRERKS